MISSTANPAVKRIRALRARKEREQSGLFFVEGIRLAAEALQLGYPIETAVVAPDLLTGEFGRSLAVRLGSAGIPLLEVTPTVFASLSGKEGPQGIALVARQRWETPATIDAHAGLCWVALDAPQDPGNVGTIMRTADAVGAAGIILLGAATDPYDPAAVRAAMGALFNLRLARASFDELVRWAAAQGCALVGTSDAADLDYQEARYRQPLVLLMGSERQGLSPEQQARCAVVARIPMAGRSDSLNLAVATGVMLYEIFNQHRRNGEA